MKNKEIINHLEKLLKLFSGPEKWIKGCMARTAEGNHN